MVSVIIPAYKAASFIGETLQSVLAQTFSDYEIILVNDGSPDTEALEAVLREYRDQVIYVKQGNKGAGAARNAGLRRAEGRFVAFLDGDDIWYPQFLIEQLDLLQFGDGYDLVYANATTFGDPPSNGHTSREEIPSKGKVTFQSLLSGQCSVVTSSVVARRDLIETVGFFDESLPNSQDFDLWLRLAKDAGARMAFHRQSLVRRRMHAGSLASDPVKGFTGELQVLNKVRQRNDLTQVERLTLERQIVRCRATIAVIQGKRQLLQDDFTGAAHSFAVANRCVYRMKLHLVLLGLQIAPRWIRQLAVMRGMPRQGPSGWLLVLPWSLEHVGGVNQVVKCLFRSLGDGDAFSPQLLITSEQTPSRDTPAKDSIECLSMNLWSPVQNQRPIRALLSFIYRFPSRFRQLRRITKLYDVKIINPHYPDLNSLMFIALKTCRQFTGDIVLSFHGDDVTGALASEGLERYLWKYLLRHVDRIVVVSRRLGSDLLTLEPMARTRVTTIYNGVHTELYIPAQRDSASRPEGNERATIISVGSFLANKGHDVLVKAFSIVVRTLPGVRLLLVGEDGPEVTNLQQLVELLSLGDKVTIVKDVPHERVPELLSKAALFVLASRREGHPLAVIEAGAAGLPVICTRTAGSDELIADGITGRLVDIGDEQSLAVAITELLTHPEIAQRLASNFHAHVTSRLAWQRTYVEYLQLVDKAHAP